VQSDNVPSDNLQSDNVLSDNVPLDNVQSDNVPSDNVPSDNVHLDNLHSDKSWRANIWCKFSTTNQLQVSETSQTVKKNLFLFLGLTERCVKALNYRELKLAKLLKNVTGHLKF
jgi:hypothetical protein